MDYPAHADSRRFHAGMALACVATGMFAVVGSRMNSILIPDARSLLLTLLFCIAPVFVMAVYWQERQRADMREGALALLWVGALVFTLPFAVDVCGRMGMPLEDANLARIDGMLGVNVPAIAAWAAEHRLGRAISATYPLLVEVLMPLAMLLPALCGRWVAAREFVVANIVAHGMGLAAFALLPAVGPWYGSHGMPGLQQARCQAELLLLRTPGPFVPHTPGVVCFPSFHVIWAVLSARALWTFRSVRVPVGLFAGMIVLSTLTTEWHYFTDVLGGGAVAGVAILVAARATCSTKIPSTGC